MGGAYNGKPITTPLPGSKVANAIARQNITTGAASGAPTTSTTEPSAQVGKYSPVGSGLKRGRIDQGVDYSGRGTLYAVGSGTIEATHAAGWPGGGTFIALRLDNPVDAQHAVVYYAEDITPNVKIGQKVKGGQAIGTANGGSTGIEIGWQTPGSIGQPLAQSTGGYSEGQQTSAGKDFVSWIDSGTISGVGTGGTQGQNNVVYQNPIVDQVPANLDPTEATTQYAETHMSKEYQGNNLLKVFQMIQTKLGSPDPSINPHVQTAPVVMK